MVFTWEQFRTAQSTILSNEFEYYIFKTTATSPRGQWVNMESSMVWLIGPWIRSDSLTTGLTYQDLQIYQQNNFIIWKYLDYDSCYVEVLHKGPV